jgi:hypothetical protein
MADDKSYLKLRAIWKDDHMFEVSVSASNGRFYGTIEVYETSESLSAFAKSLTGYPKNSESLQHEMGIRDGYSHFSMKFYCLDSTGHVGVRISLEEDLVRQPHHPDGKNKTTFEFDTEINSIDRFQAELLRLAIDQAGEATLYGRDA